MFSQLFFNQNILSSLQTVLDNPREGEPGYDIFTKYIRVLDTFEIYAEPGIPNSYVRHAAAITAELLDNDEDGVIDDEWLGNKLRERNAVMPIFEEPDSNAEREFWDDFDQGLVEKNEKFPYFFPKIFPFFHNFHIFFS